VTSNAEIIIDIIRAIEERDAERVLQLCQPDAEFIWPPSLPYGAAATHLETELDVRQAGPTSGSGGPPSWLGTWAPLQPTVGSRRMDPQVVGILGNMVVVRWHQRGLDFKGRPVDEEVLALYELVDAKLARAQMFYFDTTRVADFLARAAQT
jgi:uncharacterized protein